MKRILVVEDDLVTRKIITTVLSNRYEVVEAENGKDALSKTEGVHLILCDYYMPEMTGLQFLDEIVDKGIPSIMLTSEKDVEKKQEGKKIGVVSWITKPFVPDFILGQVKAVLKE